MSTSLTSFGGSQNQAGLPQVATEAPLIRSGGAPADGKGVDLRRILLALKRFRWLILAFTLAGLGGGFLATRLVTPQYEVTATLWIEPAAQGGEAAPIRAAQLLPPQAYAELLRSFAVLDPVVRERKLYLSGAAGPDSVLFGTFNLTDRFLPGAYEYSVSSDGQTYTLSHRRQAIAEGGAVGDSVGRNFGFSWLPDPPPRYRGRTTLFQVIHPRDVSSQLRNSVGMSLRQENFLALSLTGVDAAGTAETLNALMRQFVNEAARQKRQKLSTLTSVLDTQVTDQAFRLKTAEEQFESYRVGTITLPREDVPVTPGLQVTQPTVFGQFHQMRTERDAYRRDREALEKVLEQAQQGSLAVDAFITIPSVRNASDFMRVLNELSTAEAELRDLLTRYTEEFRGVRDLRDKIATIRGQTLPLYARALAERLHELEDELTRRIDLASRELQQIPTRAQNESRLRRDVEQADRLYRTLASSYQEAQLAEASSIADVRILDPAVAPTQPTRNTAGRLILLGFAAGVGLGLALAVLLDHLDKRVRYPEQVSQDLGLPILGTIPQIRKEQAGGGPEDAAQVIEAFRSVRLSIAHSFGSGQNMALTVSSPSPGDGKSLISANLALSFAEAGYRTVLVDGDIRRGDLHRTFAVERRPGLLDHLAGGADLTSILRPTNHSLLMLVPCGIRLQHGPELLGSPRMQDLVTLLRARFDVIIFDTPPLGAGIDPFVLATLTGNLAVILRAGETDRQLAEAKLQVLDRLPVRLLGAILNDVRVGEGAYKYYSYAYGYVAGDEDAAAPSLPAAG